MLKINSINASYGDVQVLYSVSLELRKNEIVTLLGSNGAGKTTTIRCICGLLPIKLGTIMYGDIVLNKVPSHKMAELGISLIPEGRKLFTGMSVEDNLLLGGYIYKDKKKLGKNLEWVYSLFPKLYDRKKQIAGTMSGGEQQMCAIARGLMSNPKLVIFDEPSLGLAPNIVDQIFSILKTIIRDNDSTILLVEQNVQTALEYSNRGYVLQNGHVVMEGTSEELLKSEEIQKTYLGLKTS